MCLFVIPPPRFRPTLIALALLVIEKSSIIFIFLPFKYPSRTRNRYIHLSFIPFLPERSRLGRAFPGGERGVFEPSQFPPSSL